MFFILMFTICLTKSRILHVKWWSEISYILASPSLLVNLMSFVKWVVLFVKIDTPNTHIFDHTHSWELDAATSIKGNVAKLVLYANSINLLLLRIGHRIALLVEMYPFWMRGTMYLGFELGMALPMEILAFHFIPNECDVPLLCDTTGHLDVQL